MCHKLDVRFFQELGKMNPEDVCRRALCSFDVVRECYRLTAWGEEYEIDPRCADICPMREGVPPVNTEWGLVILFYLLRASDTLPSGEWISEKDLPGGVTFFTGPHAVPTHLIRDRFGEDSNGFKKACEKLGGGVLDLADLSYSFQILPRVPVALLFWQADEEFDAEARMLFDRTIEGHLPIDVIFRLTIELCMRIIHS